MRLKSITRLSALLLFCLAVMASGCNKKEGCTDPNAINFDPDAEEADGSCEYAMGVPNSYKFEHVDYSGQTNRIKLLDKLGQKIEEAGQGTNLTEQELVDIYENNGIISADKSLAEKTYSNDKSLFYDYFTQLDTLTDPGTTSDTIIDGRFFNGDGVEIAEMVEKGLMGAVFYKEATSKYLTDEQMNVDNTDVEEGKGTTMGHHFDEAFGYLGVPKDFKSNDADQQAGNYTGSAWFWGHYILSREGDIDIRLPIFNAFLKGRTAIVNDRKTRNTDDDTDYLAKRDEAISVIKDKWELLVAANVVHYINSTLDDMSNNDTGSKWHHWSEAKAFTRCLKYNIDKKISDSQWDDLMSLLGDSPKNVSKSDLNDANKKLQNIYGFSDSQMLNL